MMLSVFVTHQGSPQTTGGKLKCTRHWVFWALDITALTTLQQQCCNAGNVPAHCHVIHATDPQPLLIEFSK